MQNQLITLTKQKYKQSCIKLITFPTSTRQKTSHIYQQRWFWRIKKSSSRSHGTIMLHEALSDSYRDRPFNLYFFQIENCERRSPHLPTSVRPFYDNPKQKNDIKFDVERVRVTYRESALAHRSIVERISGN